MTTPESIVCKPTRWFTLRAGAIFLMFAVFAVLFYIDGTTGYREKNVVFFLHKTFEQAGNQFAEMNSEQSLTPDEWAAHAKSQSVRLPEDHSILPSSVELPMPWPDVLHDFDAMKSLQWNQLWLDYSAERGFPAKPGEQPYSAGQIHEQWIVFWICLVLASGSLFVMIRTLRRRITADGQAVTTQQGQRIPYSEISRLDLRKWETKGIAYADYHGGSGKGRFRIDGLTYGGFKKEQDEPAERLMRQIRSKFSGELLTYETAIPEAAAEDQTRDDR